jgi:ATP-dependent DNA ligase
MARSSTALRSSEVAGQERLIGLEGLISKHRDTSYRTAGRFDRWGKNKSGV